MDSVVKDRFSLKTFSIAYELPFFDINDQDKLMELAVSLSKVRKDLIDALNHNLEFFKFGESSLNDKEVSIKAIEENNILFLFTLVARVDSNYVNEEEFKEIWDRIKKDVESCMTEFMENNNLMFRIIREL